MTLGRSSPPSNPWLVAGTPRPQAWPPRDEHGWLARLLETLQPLEPGKGKRALGGTRFPATDNPLLPSSLRASTSLGSGADATSREWRVRPRLVPHQRDSLSEVCGGASQPGPESESRERSPRAATRPGPCPSLAKYPPFLRECCSFSVFLCRTHPPFLKSDRHQV
jgi:hypothetical protein